MPQPYDYDPTRNLIAHYEGAALDITEKLLQACRDNRPEYAALVTHRLHQIGDINLLTLVIGKLTTGVVEAQDAAARAHGPLITAENTDPPDAWQIAVGDQMRAAAENGDMESAASLMVDGQVHSCVMDVERQGGVIHFPELVRTLMLIDQSNLTLMASEMLRRLVLQQMGQP